MQQDFNRSVWLSKKDNQSFLFIKLLLGFLGTVGLLTVAITQFLPKKAEASIITSLEPEKLVVASEPENQDPKETSTKTVIVEQGQPRLKLKLKDAVVLALQNNRVLKNAYLERIIQQNDLEEAQDKFVPDFTPQLSVSFSRNQLGTFSTNREDLEIGATVSLKIPTGAELQANWTGAGQIQSSSTSSENFLRQNFSVSLNQPLLQGFGSNINKASIKIARLQEQQNLFQLKSTLIDTITSAVIDYRALVQAQEELKIQQQALESAKRQLEITQAFIDAGRLARVDLIQNQTAVANREVDLLAAQNRLQEAQLQLLQTLDLEQNLELIALDTPKVEKSALPSPTEILKLALANNPNYLNASLDIEIAQLNLSLAKDNRRWDLSLNISYDNNLNSIREDSSEFTGSLNLNREFFGNLRLKREAIRSQIVLQQNQNNLEEARATLEIQVQNSIREVNFRLTEVEQAKRATQLSQQQLENEREKLRLGRGSIIDAIRFEEDLVNAANRELNAIIAYLNALTRLEQTIGTTLETWNVGIEGQ
jgi:outer membrane protein TolC